LIGGENSRTGKIEVNIIYQNNNRLKELSNIEKKN
jgi:hypothetical protein